MLFCSVSFYDPGKVPKNTHHHRTHQKRKEKGTKNDHANFARLGTCVTKPRGTAKSGALGGAGRQISHSHRSRTWHRAAYRSLLDARPLLSGHLHTLCSCSGGQQPCPWGKRVTLGGNGKRTVHVRLPQGDRGRCIVYIQAGRLGGYFPFPSYRFPWGFCTHSSFFMNCSMSYDWMKESG